MMKMKKLFKIKLNDGYTLMELVVSISILATLAAAALPSYLGNQNDAKATMAHSQIQIIKQAFMNHFFSSLMENGEAVFPPVPEDNIMTLEWANTTILTTGLNVSSLFSESEFPISPFGEFYRYEQFTEEISEKTGIRITDPTTNLSVEFIP